MPKLPPPLRFLLPLVLTLLKCWAVQAQPPEGQTQYLAFQLMTMRGAPYPVPFGANPPSPPTKQQMEDFVHDLIKAIGATGDDRHKLSFAATHFPFDMPDDEVRRVIHDAFAVARENDIAVAFHLDDSMYWGERKDLLANPDNLETAGWDQVPNTGRRVDWGLKPTKLAPQMCYNSPAIQAAVRARAALIGAEVIKELSLLKASGKGVLFAGIMAGSETQMGRDFETNRPLGFRALSHRGFSESHPPKDLDLERVAVVKEFMELWAHELQAAGLSHEKLFCHIAFTSQGLDSKDRETVQKTGGGGKFSPAEVAFGSAYLPGFSTYPEGATFTQIHDVVRAHGSPAWISAEGVNISPTGMPSGLSMETYLGRMFNHGAVLTNVFSWGIGGEAMRNNFFRQVTESREALAAYAKFLRGEPLVESAPPAGGFSVERFQAKIHRIQKELPPWIQKSGAEAQAMPLFQKLDAFMKSGQFQEANKVADELLALLPAGTERQP